jgi:hypothetical protein
MIELPCGTNREIGQAWHPEPHFLKRQGYNEGVFPTASDQGIKDRGTEGKSG